MAYQRKTAFGDWRRRPRKATIKESRLGLRLTEAQLERIRARAARAGLTVTSFVLWRAAGREDLE